LIFYFGIDYEENEAKINFMEQCPGKIAGIYKWPNPPDELAVSLSVILKRIPEPLPNGRSKCTKWPYEIYSSIFMYNIFYQCH
jgi:hypothetical protein